MAISQDKIDKVIHLLNEVILYLKMNDDSKELINLKNLTELKMLLKSDFWPNALSEEELNENKEEKIQKMIKNLVDIKDLNVAYFGDDAEIFVKEFLKNNVKKAVCFSLDKKANYFTIEEPNQFGIITNKKDDVLKNGPYDLVLCNDFLEHTGESPENWLEFMKSIRKSNGPIYLRAHPFCSRYHDHNLANKAYTHLIFNDSEKLKAGCPSGKKTCKQLLTENEYLKMFYNLELNIIERNVIDYPLEDIFIKNTELQEKILDTIQREKFFPEEISFEYIDYLLT